MLRRVRRRPVFQICQETGEQEVRIESPCGGLVGTTAQFLSERFPRLAALVPAERPAESFWLAAWWTDGSAGERPGPPAWLPPALLAEGPALAVAAHAAGREPGPLAELRLLDAKVGPQSLLGDQMAAALRLADATGPQVAAILTSERLFRHPIRLSADELARRLRADWQLALRVGELAPGRLAEAHPLVSEGELAPLGQLVQQDRQEHQQSKRVTDAESAGDCDAVDERVQHQSGERRETHHLRHVVVLFAEMKVRRERVLGEVNQYVAEENDERGFFTVRCDRVRREIEQQLPERDTSGFGPQIEARVGEGGQGEVDHAFVRPQPAVLRVIGDAGDRGVA